MIKSDSGVERRVRFSTASPDTLLAPGVSQFSLGLGFPLVDDIGLRTYDYARPVMSGRRRWGVTAGLTVGGSFDVELHRRPPGSRGHDRLDTRSSLARRRRAVTIRRREPASPSARATPTTGPGVRTARSFAVAGHHYSSAYRTMGLLVSEQFTSDVAIATSHTLGARFVGRLDARYQVGRDRSDAHDIAVGVMRSFGGVGLDARVSRRHDAVLHDETTVFVTARWTPRGTRGSIHAGARASSVSGVSSDLSYSRPASDAGGIGTTMGLSETPTRLGANVAVDYEAARFVTAVGASTLYDRETGATAQAASFEIATALAFASGRVAWSRPISGSFAIVERNAALDGVMVGVNPVRGGYTATTDDFGLAVVPNLDAYRLNRITVEAPALPVGYSLGADKHALVPTYKSGTLVRVGESGSVFVRGIAADATGAPLAYAVADVVSLDDPARPR